MPPIHHINETLGDFLVLLTVIGPRLTASMIGGTLIGLENQIYGKPAGLRTCLLVAISCTLLTFISIETAAIYGGEAPRITAQIVSGIGFLGGGVILRNKSKISGITTAASIWATAGIGICAGTGFTFTAVAIGILSFLVLLVLRPVDRYIDNFPYFNHLRQKDRAHKLARHRRGRVSSVSTAVKPNITVEPK